MLGELGQHLLGCLCHWGGLLLFSYRLYRLCHQGGLLCREGREQGGCLHVHGLVLLQIKVLAFFPVDGIDAVSIFLCDSHSFTFRRLRCLGSTDLGLLIENRINDVLLRSLCIDGNT